MFRIRMENIFLVFLMMFSIGCASKRDTKPTGEGAAAPILNRIMNIRTSENSESISVHIRGRQLLTYTSVKQPSPLAVLLYFPETDLDDVDNIYLSDNSVIRSVKAMALGVQGTTSRVEISLVEDIPYSVSRQDKDLKISFRKNREIPPSAGVNGTKEETLEKRSDVAYLSRDGAEKPKEQEALPVRNDTPDGVESSKPAWVNRIDFISGEAGKSTIVIGTTKPVEYNIKKTADRRILLRLSDTRLPGYRQRPLITTRFESAIDRITPLPAPATESTATFLIELREAVPYHVEQTRTIIQVHFDASSIPPKPLAAADMPSWQQVLADTPEMDEQPDQIIQEETTPSAGPSRQYTGPFRKYTGEKIALDFYDADIKNVFRILKKISGKNFAIDKDVSGRVTLAFDIPVPWDQVLEIILRMNQLGKVFEGDIIRIATTSTLQKEEENRRTEETEEQRAREARKALEPLITEYIAVSYSNAQNEIMPHIKEILTKERGTISVDDRSNLIIITDVAETIEQAKRIVERLDTVTPQVIIQARIVEANTSFSQEIGMTWTLVGGIQSTDPNAGIGPQRSFDTLGGTYGWDAAVNFPGAIETAVSGTMGFSFTRIAGTPLLLGARLRAMESQGKLKIISAPKILTLDNKKATIKQGLQYPYLERDESGLATVKFKDIDLLLEVTPHVTPDDRISLTIHITKNDIGAVIKDSQSFTTKEVETELLVNNGDTVVIGGIIKTVESTGRSGFPGLARIPLLGWLFKTEKISSEKEELLIFITPTIVKLEQRNM